MDTEELLLDISELPIYLCEAIVAEKGSKNPPCRFAEESTPAKNTPARTGERKAI